MAVTAEQPQATIMIVDDTVANLTLLDGMLRECDYRVLSFPRGDLALKAASHTAPDLILLDINMPDMNGFEVCERLKADEELKDIPVIFITALTDTADKVRAFSIGGVDYVTKPFHFEEVQARVETHLELRRQRLQLQEQYRQLQELEQLRDSLVHMIVHDMGNALAGIVGYLSIFERKFGDGLAEQGLRWVRQAQDSADGLTRMTSDLLDVSRLESGEMLVHAAECDIAAAAREVVSAQGSLIQSMGIEAAVPEGSLLVTCDAELIRRVVGNLVGNALDFSPEGGALKVAVERVESGVRVSVADKGPGIAPEHQKRIFEKFAQVAAKKRGEKHSTGLGLAFCKLAVDAHGGGIGVESEPGAGSTFWFTIPDHCGFAQEALQPDRQTDSGDSVAAG